MESGRRGRGPKRGPRAVQGAERHRRDRGLRGNIEAEKGRGLKKGKRPVEETEGHRGP
jgi:hypothetical protein